MRWDYLYWEGEEWRSSFGYQKNIWTLPEGLLHEKNILIRKDYP